MLNLSATLGGSRRSFLLIIVTTVLSGAGVSCWLGADLWVRYQFRAAREACDKGHLDEARAHVALCLKARPADADVRLLAARIERRAGAFAAAEAHLTAYKRACGVSDQYQTEWILLRTQEGEGPKYEEALWNCVRSNHPQALEIVETLAACFIREARFGAAVHCLNEWLKRDPHNARAFEWRAMAREYLQAREDALTDYGRALELDANRWEARLQLAKLLAELTRFADAARELAVLNGTHGEKESVRLAWGQVLFGQGKPAEARRVLAGLTAADNPPPLAFYYLGKLEAKPADAEKCYRKALEIQPANLEARFALYACLQQQGRSREAAAELEAYKRSRDEQDETKRLHDLMEREPYNPERLSRLGRHLLEKFGNSHGLYLLQRALALDPNHRQAHAGLARYYEKNHQGELAAKHRAFVNAGRTETVR